MSISTDGQICYGILCDADAVFPWQTDTYDGDIDEWWLCSVLGFRHSFELYDADGEYIDGVIPSQDIVNTYYAERNTFEESHPALPVDLVNGCCDDEPVYIIAVRRTIFYAKRGYPEAFAPTELVVSDEEQAMLLDFCNVHGIATDGESHWFLSSFWG